MNHQTISLFATVFLDTVTPHRLSDGKYRQSIEKKIKKQLKALESTIKRDYDGFEINEEDIATIVNEDGIPLMEIALGFYADEYQEYLLESPWLDQVNNLLGHIVRVMHY